MLNCDFQYKVDQGQFIIFNAFVLPLSRLFSIKCKIKRSTDFNVISLKHKTQHLKELEWLPITDCIHVQKEFFLQSYPSGVTSREICSNIKLSSSCTVQKSAFITAHSLRAEIFKAQFFGNHKTPN